MLNLNQIESFFPEHLRVFKRNMVREYIQCKVLEIIYESRISGSLNFMGGTAIHLIHGSARFSEDLDFDNLGVTLCDFEYLSQEIKRKLMLAGMKVTIKIVHKDAFHIHLRFDDILYSFGLSGHKQEKILLSIDSEAQLYDYKPDIVLINKFDTFFNIRVVPPETLLAQKILCIFKRKRTVGRDFYDIVFLMAKVKPDFKYLAKYLGISSMTELKERMVSLCSRLNFNILSKDIEPFVYKAQDTKKVKNFKEFIEKGI